jgi:hypothetical protein
MPDAQPRYEVTETPTLAEPAPGGERVESGHLVPLMRRGEPPVASEGVSAARVRATIEESRRFLAQYRATRPRPPRDPDELQARMMRRSGRPGVEHYARVFQVEGMPAEQARVEAQRMVEADRELLARYPAA